MPLKNIATAAAAAIMLACFAALGVGHMRHNSVTVDEFTHIPIGYSILKSGNYAADYMGNPPLLRRWLAIPLLKIQPSYIVDERPEDLQSMKTQWHFAITNAPIYHRIVEASRKQTLILGTLLGAALATAAWVYYGPAAAAVSTALYCFSPNIIAHSSLATLDAGLAFFCFAGMLAFNALVRSPGVKTAALCGAFSGLAMSAKFTGALLPLSQLACLAVVFVPRAFKLNAVSDAPRDARAGKTFFWLAASFIVAALALNASYGFDGCLVRFSELDFKSDALLAAADSVPWLRVPLPKYYILGVDAQMAASGKVHVFYLMGKLSSEGWRGYYLWTYLLKESIPAIALAAAAAVSFAVRRPRSLELFMALSAIAVFFFYSFASKVDLGARYLLPALPPIYFLCGRLAGKNFAGVKNKRTIAAACAIAIALGWHVAGAARQYPYFISYFNESAGGPEKASRLLLESNLDWGQNLIALKSYMDENGLERVMLYNYGVSPPALYGVRHDWLPCGPTEGIIAVSYNYINGVNPFERARGGDCFAWLKNVEPVAVVGRSLPVFDTRKKFRQNNVALSAQINNPESYTSF
jgi:hypothetical protein